MENKRIINKYEKGIALDWLEKIIANIQDNITNYQSAEDIEKDIQLLNACKVILVHFRGNANGKN